MQVLGRGIAERHLGEIEQSAGREVVGVFAQGRRIVHRGLLRTFSQRVDVGIPHWQQARVDGVVEQTILLFAQPQIGEAKKVAEHRGKTRGQRLVRREAFELEQFLYGLCSLAGTQQLGYQLQAQLQLPDGIFCIGSLCAKIGGAGAIEIVGVQVGGDALPGFARQLLQ